MKKVLGILATFFIAAITAKAQMPGGEMPVQQGSVKGKLVDSAGKPISGASIYILQMKRDSAGKESKEILYKTITTNSNGVFSLSEIPAMPPIKLKFTYLGTEEVDSIVTFAQFSDGKPTFQLNKNLGTIQLFPKAEVLGAVTVSASLSKPLLQMEIDKKVFNVEKNIVSSGGTALDVLRNVPSVNVDIDGNIKMRNATPQLYVDGRPTTLTADQIPSDAVESVEIMTNPSAKYDASGGNAGILNIVLKKNRKMGYNGNLRAGVDKYGGINAGADINLRQGKFNFSASGMYNQHKGRMLGDMEREQSDATLWQSSKDKDKGAFMFGKVGVDYFMNDNTTFTVTGTKMHGSMKPYSTMNIITDYTDASLADLYTLRNTDNDRSFNGNGIAAGMKKLFDQPGKQWTADFNYFGGKMNSEADYNSTYYADGFNGVSTGNSLQKMFSNGNMNFITAQTDLVLPIGENGKIETGLRAQLAKTDFFNYNLLRSDDNTMDTIANTITDYKAHNNVYAAYVTYSNSIGGFGYQIGLRAERSNYDGTLRRTGVKYSNSYPVNIFPTVYLTQKLTESQQLQFTFTRRVNRPSFMQLVPVTDYSDSLNITVGNPDLVPEFTNKYELAYVNTFSKSDVFMASVYYGRTTNLLTRFLTEQTNSISGKTDYVNTYINANSSYNTGLELTSTNKLTKWWDLTSNVNIYTSKINATQADVQQDAMWSWFGKINNSIKLPAKFSLQVSGNYQSKSNLPVNDDKGQSFGPPRPSQSSSQGYIKSFWFVDAALKKEFFKDSRLSATLAFSDIFRSNKQNQYSFGENFSQYYSRLRNPQMIRLTLAYRFGKVDASLFKKKNMNASGSSVGADSMGM